MKKFIRTIALLGVGLLAFGFSSCSSDSDSSESTVAVASVTLDKATVSVTVGGTTTLTATVSPEDATDKTVTWTSSNEDVATVTSAGLVTGIAEGSATITATVGGKTATCAVTVSATAVAVTSVALDKTTASVNVGDTTTLTATVSPDNATDSTVTWTSSNEDVATVTSAGVVTGLAVGSASITATAGGKSATCVVTVNAATVAVTSVTLNKTTVSVPIGGTTTLTATVSPDNATDSTVTWTSSDEDVATVTSAGVVTGLAKGSATITATAGGKSATCEVGIDFVAVNGETVSGAVSGSYVFITDREVTIPAMYVCDHEVTQKEYETYCAYYSNSPSSSYGKGDNYPAYFVSWYDAIVYCNLRSINEGLTPVYSIGDETDPKEWDGIKESSGKYCCNYTSSNSTWNAMTYDTTANGYRLPTDAEWEYIARNCNQDSYTYAGSDTIDDVAWYRDNSDDTTHEVKGKDANGLGIYDMNGNVWEWCWDWKGEGAITSNTAATGATSGSTRIERGGSLNYAADGCKVSSRGAINPITRATNGGFRVVRSSSN
ncbi:MAG: Ig-like domain-containing protein [Treponema sp.]|nr:Ig-like domain-containing protein [Treponema sp.]